MKVLKVSNKHHTTPIHRSDPHKSTHMAKVLLSILRITPGSILDSILDTINSQDIHLMAILKATPNTPLKTATRDHRFRMVHLKDPLQECILHQLQELKSTHKATLLSHNHQLLMRASRFNNSDRLTTNTSHKACSHAI